MIVGFHTQQLRNHRSGCVNGSRPHGPRFSVSSVCADSPLAHLKEIVAAVLHTGRSVASLVSDTSAASTRAQSSALGSDSHSFVTKGKILLGDISQRESDSVPPHHSGLISVASNKLVGGFCLEVGLENLPFSFFVVGAA